MESSAEERDPLLCPGDGCEGCRHCQGDDTEPAEEITSDLAARLAAAESERDEFERLYRKMHGVMAEKHVEAERLRAAVEALADNISRVIEMHRHLVMDTAEDRALHARVVEASDKSLARLRALLAAGAEADPDESGERQRTDGTIGGHVFDCHNRRSAPDWTCTCPPAVAQADEREALTVAIQSVTGLWDEPLDEVHDVPQIVNALLAAGYRRSPGADLLAEAERRIEALVEPDHVVGYTDAVDDALRILRDLRAADAEGSGR